MRQGRGALIGAAVLMLASRAHAGNDDSFFQGNEAAMMGGAVTAVGTGPGQLWYNPAALGANTRNRLELSGSLFTLRVRSLDPFIDLSVFDEDSGEYLVLAERDERNLEFLSVPSALSYTRQIGPKVTAGFGIFVQSQDSVAADRTISYTEGAIQLDYRRTLNFQQQRLFAGPGFGANLGRLRIGASLFLVYDRFEIEELSSVVGSVGGLGAVAKEDFRVDLRRIGLELVLGMQLQLTDRWLAALVVRGPRIKLSDRVEETLQIVEAVGDDTDAAFDVLDLRGRGNINDASGALATPLEVVVSFGYRGDKVRLGLDVDLQHAYSGLFEYAFNWNVRLGMTYVSSDTLEIGVGLFTDRAALLGEGGFDLFVDYYGASLAATLSTPVGLRPSEDGDETPDKLIFRTTLSLRYAVGVGLSSGATADVSALDSDPENFVFLFGEEQYVLFHELGIYIGSGLDF